MNKLNMPPETILSPQQWQPLANQHAYRAEKLTRDHLARRKAGITHPVFDFLFEYYPIRVAHLQRWHPGVGIGLTGDCPQASWRNYHTTHGVTTADINRLFHTRGDSIRYLKQLLIRTETNPVHFDCFGLHEWAMVYKTNSPRHNLPLRLGAAGSDAVVEAHSIRCTHVDAFRFFTPAARPLNLTVLNRQDQPVSEQRACLHAAMDLYKWAAKLSPLVPGDLWLDCFELAWDARILDMEASPYDCRAYGLGVVAIETPAGKAEYVERQRQLAQRATPLRNRLVEVISQAEQIKLVSADH
ncbi:hypothetical protein ACFLIN_00160 [Corynebacterium kutscheri]|nr:hypothetical protein [Corynebacterium kutscheri]